MKQPPPLPHKQDYQNLLEEAKQEIKQKTLNHNTKMSLCQNLNKHGYLCDQRFANTVLASLHNNPVAGAFLFGPAGTGKSYLPEVLSQINQTEMHFYQCFPGTREDDLLVKILPSEDTVSGVAMHDGVILRAVEAAKAGKKTYLVLDEWDKTRPSADSFLLDFLQNGRVDYNGHSAKLSKKDMSHLTVFITMNDEREISEPLLRRLPKIDFKPLHYNLVKEALLRTHPNHLQVEACVRLYNNTVNAGLSKPATIQELRQLLDAITLLQEEADWNDLVYQFVTKTPEQHYLLSQYRGEKISFAEPPKIEVADFEEDEEEIEEEEAPVPTMPAPRLVRPKVLTPIQKAKVHEEVPAEASGVVELNEHTYDTLVGLSTEPSEDENTFKGWGRVLGKTIILDNPILMKDYGTIEKLWGQKGEILFIEPKAKIENVVGLRKHGLKIVKYTTSEILGYTTGIELRWTQEAGAEIVVNLENKDSFRKLFSANEKNNNNATPDQWLKDSYDKKDQASLGFCLRKEGTEEKPASVYRRKNRWRQQCFSVELPHISFIVQMEKNGQTSSNNVEVKMSVHRKITDQKNVQGYEFMGGEDIGNSWWQNNSEIEGYRKGIWKYEGKMYKEAFQAANEAFHKEAVALIKMYRKRRQALEAAERSLLS